MVICIQRKKRKKKKSSGVHCPVTKKLEALITRYTSPTHPSFLFHAGSVLAFRPLTRLLDQRLLVRSTSFAAKDGLRQSSVKENQTKPGPQPLRSLCVFALLEETV